MLCMVIFWDPVFISVNAWGELNVFTLTDPKFKEDGLSLTVEFARALVPPKLPRITITIGHTQNHDLLVDCINLSGLTDISGSGRGDRGCRR